MELSDLTYIVRKPPAALNSFVESFWMLGNQSEKSQDVVILPDGRVDIFFSAAPGEPYHVTLMGLETNASQSSLQPGIRLFAVSLKLPGVEYILQTSIADHLDTAHLLPDDLWGLSAKDLDNFDAFCEKVTHQLLQLLSKNIDDRKLQLFELIYAAQGSITVKALSEKLYWNSRQINRYFTQWFGLPVKTYCSILRFRASFQHIKAGKLFPEAAFADQSHFIRDVRKYAGVAPSALSKNKNDRFIQFSLLKRK